MIIALPSLPCGLARAGRPSVPTPPIPSLTVPPPSADDNGRGGEPRGGAPQRVLPAGLGPRGRTPLLLQQGAAEAGRAGAGARHQELLNVLNVTQPMDSGEIHESEV